MKRLILFGVLLVYLMFFTVGIASAGDINYVYPGLKAVDSEFTHFSNAVQTSDGGFMFFSGGGGSWLGLGSNPWLVKMDAGLNVQNSYSYGDGSSTYNVLDGIGTSDGGYILTGAKEHDAWLMKIDQNNLVEWERTYKTGSKGALEQVLQTSDGYIAVGVLGTEGAGLLFDDTRLYIIKVDASGTVSWEKEYTIYPLGSPNFPVHQGFSIAPVSSGGYFISGRECPDSKFGSGVCNRWHFRIDVNGNMVSGTESMFSNGLGGSHVIPTDDDGDGQADEGYIYFGSASTSAGTPMTTSAGSVIKYDTNLATQWAEPTVFTSPGYYHGIQASNGDFIGGGSGINQTAVVTSEAGIARHYQAGGIAWARNIEEADKIHAVYETSLGDILVLGVSDAVGSNPAVPWAALLGANGDTLSTCSGDDVILKLSADTDAHGAVYDDGTYTTTVCYSDVVGSAYTGGDANPQTCDANAPTILGLSGSANAHAEDPSLGVYSTQVCHDGFSSCRYDSTGACALAGEYEVVEISGASNAHLAKAGSGFYSGGICCTVGGGGAPMTPIWTDLSNDMNEIIDQCIGVGSKVKLIGLPGVTSFEVYQENIVSGTLVATLTPNSGQNFVEWLITGSEITQEDQYYFTAITPGGDLTSGKIKIRASPCPNKNPEVVITGAVHKGVYFTGNSISLDHSSYDPDGDITKAEWFVNDILIATKLTNDVFDQVNYVPNSPGQVNIRLKVTDNGNAQDEKEIAIAVLDDNNDDSLVFTFVNNPIEGEIVVSPLFDGNYWKVDYNGSDSYVLSKTACNVNCLAGSCHSDTINILGSASCGVPGEKYGSVSPGGAFADMDFNWAFDDGTVIQGLKEVSGPKAYTVTSKLKDDKKITLNIDYDLSPSVTINGMSDREFTLVGENLCLYEQGSTKVLYYDPDTGDVIEVDVNSNPDAGDVDTYRIKVLGIGGSQTNLGVGKCCPCGQDFNSGLGSCAVSNIQIDSCADINDGNLGTIATRMALCTAANEPDGSPISNCNVDLADAINLGGVDANGDLIGLGCTWDSAIDECEDTVRIIDHDDPSEDICFVSDGSTTNSCVVTVDSETQCLGNSKILTLSSTEETISTVTAECDPVITDCTQFGGPHNVLCGRPRVQLSFFSGWNFVFVGLLVGVLHYLMFVGRRKQGLKITCNL